jgi:DNA-binding winged helix-turn-helix (wHTH) protein/TolB-like protein
MNTEKIRLFEDFTLDLARGCLLRGNLPIHLRPHSYEVLKYLVANKGRLISKDELIEDVWQGRAVTDGSLGKCIEELRAALGKEARQYVRNVRGRGYIFDPKTDEQLESEPGWSEQIDVVRVLVEEEYHQDDAALRRSSTVTPPASGVSADSRQRLSQTKAIVLTIAVLLVVSVAVMTAYYYSSIAPKAAAASNVKSLAVLPFKSLSGETGDEYLGLGMADTLITRLSNLKEMAVRPTSSVMKYGDSSKDRIEICRELGVDAVLEGSIHISGGRMRVTVQLVSVGDQTPIWADTLRLRTPSLNGSLNVWLSN